MDLIADIQTYAIELKHQSAEGLPTELDAANPSMVLPTERPLFAPMRQIRLDSTVADPEGIELDASVLYEQVYVDSRELATSVRGTLRHTGSIGLIEHLDQMPLTHGIAELVAYLSLRDDDFDTIVDEEARDVVKLTTSGGVDKIVRFPCVTYIERYGSRCRCRRICARRFCRAEIIRSRMRSCGLGSMRTGSVLTIWTGFAGRTASCVRGAALLWGGGSRIGGGDALGATGPSRRFRERSSMELVLR